MRADLAEVVERHEVGLDARRPDAVAKRRARNQRTARENIADLVDPDSFVEYAPLVIAGQRRRRSLEELIERTPADGLVGGVATIAGRSVVVMSYDYTVLAGTQGMWNHEKKDRLFELAARLRTPVVLFAEGGGGRPGDTDGATVAGLDCLAFNLLAQLSGLVPLIGITSGYCFAGNARAARLLRRDHRHRELEHRDGRPRDDRGWRPRRVRTEPRSGPPRCSARTASSTSWCPTRKPRSAPRSNTSRTSAGRRTSGRVRDQRALRHLVPENRLRAYEIRPVLDALCDTGSVFELRRDFAPGIVTALARVEGKPVGIVANNPSHLGGAIDTPGADKAARFLQLCDAFDVPIVFLCDTPGFMVGPESEATAAVRHMSRLFVTGANVTVPFGTIILRKGYGLGAQAMAGGSFKAPLFCVAWPTGEFGGMNLEGAVRLGQRRELDAIKDPAERERAFRTMVDHMYEHGKATNMATYFEIDDVIDPADSRRWIGRLLDAAPAPADAHRQEAPPHRHVLTLRETSRSRHGVRTVWRRSGHSVAKI